MMQYLLIMLGRSQCIDPFGNRSTYLLDALDRRTEGIDPLGNRTTTLNDAVGRLVATFDRMQRLGMVQPFSAKSGRLPDSPDFETTLPTIGR